MGRNGIGKTNVGYVRQNNEDSLFVLNGPIGKLQNLYIVADGMGGHNAGEVASAAAIDHFCTYIRENAYSNQYIEELLASAAIYANDKVFELSLADQTRQGMGTTLSVCCYDADNLYFTHIGDSRIYLLSGETLTQLTADHTFVEEMVKSGQMTEEEAQYNPSRHMLTRALGTEYGVAADAGYTPIQNGDLVLLCSDGLSNMLDNEALAAILRGEGTVENKAEQLVAQALANGGLDNVTVILL